MKVLISAFACAPGSGSEQGQGWGVVQQAAREHKVWALVDVSCQQAILDQLNHSPLLADVQFLFVDPGFRVSFARSHTQHGLYYIAWQLAALKKARQINERVGLDLIHHVTYGSAWMPSFLGRLGVPFIVRAGAKELLPTWYAREISAASLVREGIRSAGIIAAGPIVEALATSKATAVLSSSSPETWSRKIRFRPFALGGLGTSELGSLSRIRPRRSSPLVFASIGNLIGWKGISLAIEAFSEFARSSMSAEYWIIGDGIERASLSRVAYSSPARDRIHFLGHLTRAEVFARLSHIDVLIHPALHEEFGYAVLEAMAAGKPVVCMNLAGPRHLVTERCGVRIMPDSKSQVVREIANAMLSYSDSPDLRLQDGSAGRERALSEWSWDAVGCRLLSVYDEVLSGQLPAVAQEA